MVYIASGTSHVTSLPSPPDLNTGGVGISMGGDPHFSVLLPNGQLICYSIQGEHGFTFNLISNKVTQVNALFVPDSRREEVTWIGAMGIVAKGSRYKKLNDTKLRFMAEEEKIYLGEKAVIDARGVGKIHLARGKLTLEENERDDGMIEVEVVLEDVGLEFCVRFVKRSHLDMIWKKVVQQSQESHGLIGKLNTKHSPKDFFVGNILPAL